MNDFIPRPGPIVQAPAPRFYPRKRERREQVNINIPPSLWNEITQVAEQHGVSRNEFIEDALRFALTNLPERYTP